MENQKLATRLRERVTIEAPDQTADGYGGVEAAWATVATVWAEVTPVQTRVGENEQAGQRHAVAGYRVAIRNRDDVDATMRILWRDRVLSIHSLHLVAHTLQILTYEEGV